MEEKTIRAEGKEETKEYKINGLTEYVGTKSGSILFPIIHWRDLEESGCVGDVYALFKDSFKDMMQELLEAEMDASI